MNNEVVVRVRVRDSFVPAEGWLFLSAGTSKSTTIERILILIIEIDYCQIEFRILAYLSQDNKLISLLNQKYDVFKLIASQLYPSFRYFYFAYPPYTGTINRLTK